MLKALANEARLMIVDTLGSCECCVGDLTGAVNLDMSTVSKHLSVLASAGIIGFKKVGNTVHYRLLTPCVLELFSCADKVLGDDDSPGAQGEGRSCCSKPAVETGDEGSAKSKVRSKAAKPEPQRIAASKAVEQAAPVQKRGNRAASGPGAPLMWLHDGLQE